MSKAIKELIAKRDELAEEKVRLDKEIADVDGEIAQLAIAEYRAPVSRQAPKKKQGPRKFNHETTAKKYADFEPAATGCLCGCGEHVPDGKLFVNGHWKSLESIARAFEAGKIDREKMSEAGYKYAVSKEWIEG